MNKAVFFDRDGVLNQADVRNGKPYPPADANALCIALHARESLQLLKDLGYVLICVTNQPDVSRGTRTLDNVQSMNAKVMNALPLDDLYVCLHDTQDQCSCRKPKPGMLLEASQRWHIDLASSYMVGDRAGDILAGVSAGCASILIDCGYLEPQVPEEMVAFRCTNLQEACAYIAQQTKEAL